MVRFLALNRNLWQNQRNHPNSKMKESVTDITAVTLHRQALFLHSINPTALRTAKTLWSFGCFECNRVNVCNYIIACRFKSQNTKLQPICDPSIGIFFQKRVTSYYTCIWNHTTLFLDQFQWKHVARPGIELGISGSSVRCTSNGTTGPSMVVWWCEAYHCIYQILSLSLSFLNFE